MDQESRDMLREVRDSVGRLESKLSEHLVIDATAHERLAAHLVQCENRRKWWIALWMAVTSAFLTALLALITKRVS